MSRLTDLLNYNKHKFENEHDYNSYVLGATMCVELGEAENSTAFNDKAFGMGFIHAMRTEHRYLQSGIIWTLLQVLSAYGKTEHYDTRNEGAVKACKELRDLMVEKYGIYTADEVPNYMEGKERESTDMRRASRRAAT